MTYGAKLSLDLVFAICDRGKEKKITPFFKSRNALFSLMGLGEGTASSKVLDYLGLGRVDKTFLLSVMPSDDALDVLAKIDDALDLKQPGHGIAFTLPVDSVCVKEDVKTLSLGEEGNGGDKVTQEFQYALIFAVANRGYSEEVMDAARAAKARGGTVIHGRGTAPSGADQFFGVTLQPEREVIIILASRDTRDDIMKSIVSKAGPGTPANAFTFSVPADNVTGLQSYIPDVE